MPPRSLFGHTELRNLDVQLHGIFGSHRTHHSGFRRRDPLHVPKMPPVRAKAKRARITSISHGEESGYSSAPLHQCVFVLFLCVVYALSVLVFLPGHGTNERVFFVFVGRTNQNYRIEYPAAFLLEVASSITEVLQGPPDIAGIRGRGRPRCISTLLENEVKGVGCLHVVSTSSQTCCVVEMFWGFTVISAAILV